MNSLTWALDRITQLMMERKDRVAVLALIAQKYKCRKFSHLTLEQAHELIRWLEESK